MAFLGGEEGAALYIALLCTIVLRRRLNSKKRSTWARKWLRGQRWDVFLWSLQVFFYSVYHTRNLNQKTWTDLDGIEMHPIFFQLGWNLDGDWPIRRQNPYQHQFVNVSISIQVPSKLKKNRMHFYSIQVRSSFLIQVSCMVYTIKKLEFKKLQWNRNASYFFSTWMELGWRLTNQKTESLSASIC
jgi:hypothetical protein